MKNIINWGFGLTVIIILFVLSVAATIIFASFQKVELVDRNYYANSLMYQKQIDKMNNYNQLKDNIHIVQNIDKLLIIFPKEIISPDISGNIVFFKPNDSRMDFETKIKTDTGNCYSIDLNKLVKGKWLIKIDWKANNKEFYCENEITIR